MHPRQEKKYITPQRPEISQELLKVFTDFLSGDRSARIYNFMYQDDIQASRAHTPHKAGVDSWDAAMGKKCKTGRYYVYDNEVALIKSAAAEIAQAVSYRPLFIELGTGSPKAVHNKTLPLVHALKPRQFIANDFSLKSVEQARTIVRDSLPGLDVRTCRADFLDPESSIHQYTDANVFLAGCTISNIMAYNGYMPVNEVVSYLRTISQLVGDKGSLIITQDTNHDPQSLKAAYSTPGMAAFFKDVLYRIQAYAGLESFDPSAFDYEAVWDEQSHLLANTLVSRKTQTVRIGNTTVTIPQGRRLYVIHSYKYPTPDFLHMARIAGLEPVRTWMDTEDRVALHVLKKKPATPASARDEEARTA